MTRLLLASGLSLDLAHRTDAFSAPALVLDTWDATGGFLAADAPAVAAALDAGDTATFRDGSDPSITASVTVTPDTLTLQLDDTLSELPVTPDDRHKIAQAIRAAHLSPLRVRLLTALPLSRSPHDARLICKPGPGRPCWKLASWACRR